MLALFAVASGEQTTPYIEQVFSTYLYTGNGSTQTITNGIDLSTKGGLVWTKSRNEVFDHYLADTARGVTKGLASNGTSAQTTDANGVTAFGATGYTIGDLANINSYSPRTYVSWTFREQAKFFDVVTYTGTGSNTTIAHNLDSVPGCIIVKRTDTTADWQVYHRSLANTQYIVLNSTAAVATGATRWNSTTPTSTVFSVGTDASVNASGGTYVAYLFAHDAGGFGQLSTENVISCGSYTGNGSATGPVVTLGYEPQWVMIKNTTGTGNWQIMDTMRGMVVVTADSPLQANLANAESSVEYGTPLATGFQITSTSSEVNTSASTYIYIAIRRGPMQIPGLGTTVFGTLTRTGDDTSAPIITPNIAMTTDMVLTMNRSGGAGGSAGSGAVGGFVDFDRLRNYTALYTISSNGEPNPGAVGYFFNRQNGVIGQGLDPGQFFSYDTNLSGYSYINYFFRRAPSFFDEVCYTGTGSNTTQAHNLGVVPELIIVKRRDTTADWDTYCSALANTEYVVLNTTSAKTTGATRWNSTTPTASVFSIGTSTATNASAGTYVAYLFASCLGVSKVGSYTGTATTQQINCNFTTGARFVLIKRTDTTGDWYVWDTARGIIAGNDPYLLVNSNAAEVTSTDYVDAYAAGFELTSTAPAAINANGGTYIFLAIA
jgi:hypothetical protein